MKRTRVLAVMMAAAVMLVGIVPLSAEAGVLRRRDGTPRVWTRAAKAAGKTVTQPFGGRVRRNQRGALCGAF